MTGCAHHSSLAHGRAAIDVGSRPEGGGNLVTRAFVRHVLVAAGVLSLVLAACAAPASRSQSTPRPTATPLAVLAFEYSNLVRPVNRAYSDLVTALCFGGATGCTPATMATAQPLFRTYQSSLTDLNDQLPAFQASVPAAAQADLGQYRQAIATEISDLSNVVQDTDETQFWADESRWAPETFRTDAADKLVRADLHITG